MVFYDLEYTSWKGYRESGWDLPGKYMEIVQIGAVRVDLTDNWLEMDAFSIFVKPVRNPLLSDYFIDLTGITQNQISEQGRDFPEALASFMEYLSHDDAQMASHGPDHEVVALNCQLNGIPVPERLEGAINIRPWVMSKINLAETKYTSGELPQVLGLAHDGKAHDALGDARAVAAVYQHLNEQGISTR